MELPRQIDTAVAIPQTYLFSLAQPEPRYYLTTFRAAGVFRPIDGATVQATYVFQPNQPELSRFFIALNSRLTQTGPTQTGPSAQFQGATRQDTYGIPVSQPVPHHYFRNFRIADMFRFFEGSTHAATLLPIHHARVSIVSANPVLTMRGKI